LLAETLGRQLGQRTYVSVAETYKELETKVLSREVDIAWAPPSICAQAEQRELTILKAVRQSRSMYRSVLVCRQADELTIDTLEGTRAAWVDPQSTGGRLLAISLLRQRGFDPRALFSSETYHGSYQGALLSVIRGQADVSATFCYGVEDVDTRWSLSEHVGASEVQLRGFAFTDESPSDGLIDTGASEYANDLIELLLTDSRNRARTLLLELIEAETLERAADNDYWAIRQALVEL
jgi:ABC-type phosphate/phosphonate transport system substrate-binding protein